MPIETLNDLFSALFRPGAGERPVIRQPVRPLREDLFGLFFPEALVRQYEGRSKSNLTWFFTSDQRNKSVRRSLIDLMRQDVRSVAEETHRKCRQVLWPRAGHPVFEAEALEGVLAQTAVPAALDAALHITFPGPRESRGRLARLYAVDEAAALSRVILTLAVAGDGPQDVMTLLWQEDAGSDLAYMRGDDSPAGTLRYCRMLDLQGRHEQAYEGYLQLAEALGRPAATADESALYMRLGEMLFKGEGCARDEGAARAFDRLGCLDGNPASWMQLSAHITGAEAREALERSAELGFAAAIRRLGEAWHQGSARLSCGRNPENARCWFARGMTLPGEDGAWCGWMLGQVCEEMGRRAEAVDAYRFAREAGSREAARRLSALDWLLPPQSADGEAPRPGARAGYCVVDGSRGCNRIFLEGLQGPWEVTVCGTDPAQTGLPAGARVTEGDPASAVQTLAEKVYWGGAAAFPPLLIALMHDDGRRNLLQAVALLARLEQLARALGARAWELVDAVQIYVLADHEEGRLLLDTAFSGMDRLYFRLRLCDPALDAVDALLSRAPLFLPRLGDGNAAPVQLAILGSGDVAMAMLLRALALPMPADTRIRVYSGDAEALQRRFFRRCPGIRSGQEALCGPLPQFCACDWEEAAGRLLEDALKQPEGHYWVVAGEDDMENLRLGAALRGGWMRRFPGESRRPFIAVHTARPVMEWLGDSLSAGGEDARWALMPFGGLEMYAPDRLAEDSLEQRAVQAHMLYLGLPNTPDARHTALGDYCRRQTVRDTARTTALSLVYRVHLAGIDLPAWQLYGSGEAEAALGTAYTRWLEAEDHLQTALRQEHQRRSRALLTLGWERASLEDVAAWVAGGCASHRLYPARLDPFLCPWEALEAGDLAGEVRRIVKGRFPEKAVPDPRRDEEASLRDTERILAR
ncbi:MAG: hypothetical protein IJH38_01530 [Clostridia bacterium]|nr:hypothetical protein [Clostridia bacterium]